MLNSANHFHGIVVLLDNDSRGDSRIAPTSEKRKSLGRIIGAFKTVSTKRINELRGIRGMQFWQRNYYEHVIRNERSLNAIRRYIHDNPLLWYLDEDNPRCQNSSPDDMTRAFKKNGFTDEEIHYLHKLKPCLLQPLKSKVFI